MYRIAPSGSLLLDFMNENRTILLVDDNVDDIFLTRTAFTNAKLTNPIQEAHNGDEAIAYLQGEPPFDDRSKFPLPALMLLDLSMPTRNGFQVLEWLRAQPGLKRINVVILTASLRQEDVDRAFDLGANSFLVKPSSIESLTSVSRCLRDWMNCTQFPHVAEPVQNSVQ